MTEPHIELERRWAEWNGLNPEGMVVCSSGTAALHLALESLQLPLGSEVIVPDLTMIACPRAVTLAGLQPVFVDCDATLNMDTELAYKALSLNHQNCRGILYVHTYGRQCETRDIRIAEAFRDHGFIIEDLAEAHGVDPGPFTNAACWSFYRNKIVHGEEGGAVWFKNPGHAVIARQLRSLGFTDAHDFVHVPRGHNYRMSNAHATLILNNLSQAAKNISERWAQLRQLDAACPDEWLMPSRQAPWVYDIRIPGMTTVQQDAVVNGLNSIGILARHCFKPTHLQREYAACKVISAGRPYQRRAFHASQEVIYIGLQLGRPRIDQIVFREIQRILNQ